MTAVTQETKPKPVVIPFSMPNELKHYDKITKAIYHALWYIKFSGKPVVANMYVNSPMLYNFMVVGATGVFINWIVFNLFRMLIGGGIFEFIAFVGATLCTFMWNFVWNKKWALNIHSQLLKLSVEELENVGAEVNDILNTKKGGGK
jgi:hypothetical protein